MRVGHAGPSELLYYDSDPLGFRHAAMGRTTSGVNRAWEPLTLLSHRQLGAYDRAGSSAFISFSLPNVINGAPAVSYTSRHNVPWLLSREIYISY